jgi:predicted ATPase/serine phosphatase RsbU (regulator of sigma subunit)/tRNA A-37 threonylcarbamoyl transferase component Bud32
MLILPHYEILSQIYESANSLVYRGIRKKDNQPVILKMLKEEYPTPQELTRYQQEYELTNHLNLDGVIKGYAIEKYHNTPIIILEDFGGKSLKQLIANQSLTLTLFLPIAIQIADSLAHIHQAHLIHKDINPNNIVINPETYQLKIIDFGIATRLPRERLTLKNPEHLEGTLPYLSPEQTGRINRSLDYRTDLYSLGVTFYELLTGALPFQATEAMELVHCHLAKIAEPVYAVNPDVPPIVSDIVMKLMAKNAEDRYQSALGVKADLQHCEIQLTQSNQIAFFSLAQNDFSGNLHLPQKLYGREKEIKTFIKTFESISDGRTEMMLIAGYSGVGKTALVREVHKPMTAKRGYFAAGKFDQFKKNVPYSAISQAFNEFCRYLLRENPETLAKWRSKIREALGNNGQIIIDVIPDLELVIGQQPPVAKVGATETQNRFQMFFLNFVRVLCDKDHPFILFIDDLQWVDSASLALLKTILLDEDIQYLFIIGAYRDNEVDNTHPLFITLCELEKAQARIKQIELKNLLEADIQQLLQDTLNQKGPEMQALSDLIYQKTQGNAFFTHQFLYTLYEKGLLHFDFQQLKWQWNIQEITAQNITANVVELMANKIENLPSNTSKVLQLAACMGNQFDLDILAIVHEQDKNKILDCLHPALTEGLIQPLDDNYKHLETTENSHFKFLHDRVQQAAYALIDDEQKQVVHLQIGRLLLKNTPAEALEDKVFEIVEHFNQSLELSRLEAERIEIAKLNLLAGQKAKMATAYSAALNYLSKGQACLIENSWENEYDLTLSLFTEAAEAAYLSGDFKQMAALAKIVLEEVRTLSDEVEICEIQILACVAQNQLQQAIEIALFFLKRLGITIPLLPTEQEIGDALQEIQTALSDQSIPSLIDLPLMKNNCMILAMRIMVAVTPAAYQVSPQLMILLILKQVEVSLEYGNTSESSYSYVAYGFILSGVLFNIESGYQFGQLGLELLKKIGAKAIQPRTHLIFNYLVKHWKVHLNTTLEPLLNSYQLGLETGDLEFSGYSLYVYFYSAFLIGKPLVALEQEMAEYNHAIVRLKQKGPLNWHHLFWQVILNLKGESEHPCQLRGKVYDETLQLPLHEEANDRTALHHLHFNKCLLHYLFHDYALAVENADKAAPYLDSLTSSAAVVMFHFYDSLARLGLYPHLSQPEQQAVLNTVSANQDKMKQWASHAPMNYLHKFYLVQAERSRVLGKEGKARKFYDKAIELAQKNQYLNDEALAYELAAHFYLLKGKSKIAQVYLRDAHYAYQSWGAFAKVKDLERRYPQIFTVTTAHNLPPDNTISSTQMARSSNTYQWLDLSSIMKAAQTLSEEIVLSRLLKKMMLLVIENAGAEIGFLLLPQNKQWFIEASGQIDNDDVKVLQSLSLENQPIARTIIHYVKRTQEHVVLNHATRNAQFTHDPHITTQRPKSILCLPLVNQGQLTGLLYLENNLTTGAFTQERLDVLKILSSQLAISIENALLYRTLEQKVEQRTAELAQANQEIMALNEQLKEDNIRMSAELKVSRRLQQMLLPKEEALQAIEGLDIAGFMAPADEVGGDYYDVLSQDGKILIGIGDVTGHGLESGALAIMVQSTVRGLLANQETDPVKFISALNQMVYHNVLRMNAEKSMTLSLLFYQNGSLILTGQHEEVIVVRAGGRLEKIDTIDLGFPIGLEEEIAEFINHLTIRLNTDDVVVLYTDGITEAFNPQKTEYGIDRLCEVVRANREKSSKNIRAAVIDNVCQFIGEEKVYDDMTLLILKQH